MSSSSEVVFYGLWIAHPVLQAGVSAVMWWRKQHRTFPIFFSYILSQICIFAILFPIQSYASYRLFFYSYWLCSAASLTLGFAVIHEIFLNIFLPYHTLKDLGTVLFKWAALVLLLVAGVVAAASPGSADGPLVQAVLTVQRCVRVIQCGLVLFLLVFSRYLMVSWRQQSFGIAMGFGSFASVEMIIVALSAGGYISVSTRTEHAVSTWNMVAYNIAILVWLGYALGKSVAREPSVRVLASQRWEQSLSELQRPVPAESLIPMFEGIVDRALSRRPEPEELVSEPPKRTTSHATSPSVELRRTSFPVPRTRSQES
jgi:hypothetical protein